MLLYINLLEVMMPLKAQLVKIYILTMNYIELKVYDLTALIQFYKLHFCQILIEVKLLFLTNYKFTAFLLNWSRFSKEKRRQNKYSCFKIITILLFEFIPSSQQLHFWSLDIIQNRLFVWWPILAYINDIASISTG